MNSFAYFPIQTLSLEQRSTSLYSRLIDKNHQSILKSKKKQVKSQQKEGLANLRRKLFVEHQPQVLIQRNDNQQKNEEESKVAKKLRLIYNKNTYLNKVKENKTNVRHRLSNISYLKENKDKVIDILTKQAEKNKTNTNSKKHRNTFTHNTLR